MLEKPVFKEDVSPISQENSASKVKSNPGFLKHLIRSSFQRYVKVFSF